MLYVNYILIKRETNQKSDTVELYEGIKLYNCSEEGKISSIWESRTVFMLGLEECIDFWRVEIHRAFQ